MKMSKSRSLLIIGTLLLSTMSHANSFAAPQLVVTNADCFATKISGNQYSLNIKGSYYAPSNISQNYKINGYRATLKNTGGQQVRTTGLVSIEPTYIFNYDITTTETQTFVSSLKSVTFEVYNGGSLKGTATATCRKP